MSLDHERIEELLAGYALRALSGPDAEEADRLLTDHVPTCPACRATLGDFDATIGDLALAAAPAAPPDLLLPAIRRQLSPTRARRSGRMVGAWMAAAAMVAILALAGWSVLLDSRMDSSERRSAALSSMVDTLMKEDGSQMVALGDEAGDPSPALPAPSGSGSSEPRLMVSYRPGAPHGWVLGMDIPPPTPGNVYQLWLGRDGFSQPAARFVPDEIGLVQVFIEQDLSAFDEISITEEPAQIVVVTPGGTILWGATMAPPATP